MLRQSTRPRTEIAAATGADILALPCDVSRADEVARLVQSGIERFGRIDILVTNGGGPPAGPFESFSAEAWEAATRLTLFSAIELARQVLPGMKERRWGRILNITSIAVKQPVDNLILSNSLRAAVTGFARTLANEVATFGITVNNIMPGYTRTERVEELARMMAEKEGITPGGIHRALGERNSHATPGRTARVRGAGGFSGFGTRQLYHRHFDSG